MREFLVAYHPYLDIFFFVYFSIINLAYLILSILGGMGVFKRIQEIHREDYSTILRSTSLPEITFIIPVYNNSAQIISCIESIRRLSYKHKQIIVVNDGSTDDTLPLLKERFQLKSIPIFFHETLPSKPLRGVYESFFDPHLIVIDKENGQKPDAVNAGMNACQSDYMAVVDSDTFLEEEEFEELIRPLFFNPETVAVGTAVKVKNGCEVVWDHIETTSFPKDYISAVQAVEYLRAFLLREGWDSLNANYLLSGAFAVFIKDVVVQMGGFGPTIANDMEIIFRINRMMRATKTPYHVAYLPDPVAWTEAPDTFKELSEQRARWHRGLLECLWFHRSVMFNPKHGIQGLLVHPFLFFFEALEPLIEIAGYLYIIVGWWFGVVNPFIVVLFVLVTMGFSFIQTLFSLLIEEFSFRKYPSLRTIFTIFAYSLIENLGYRQLTLIWRAKGFFDFFKRYGEIKKDSKELNHSIDDVVKKGQLHW